MLHIIDCCAVIFRAKPAFGEWLASEPVAQQIPEEIRALLNDVNLSSLRANGTVYMLPRPEKDILAETTQYIAAHAEEIITAELERLGLKHSAKPSQSAVDLLQAWFDVTHHRFLYALAEEENAP
jgi:hypothetical protein